MLVLNAFLVAFVEPLALYCTVLSHRSSTRNVLDALIAFPSVILGSWNGSRPLFVISPPFISIAFRSPPHHFHNNNPLPVSPPRSRIPVSCFSLCTLCM